MSGIYAAIIARAKQEGYEAAVAACAEEKSVAYRNGYVEAQNDLIEYLGIEFAQPGEEHEHEHRA